MDGKIIFAILLGALIITVTVLSVSIIRLPSEIREPAQDTTMVNTDGQSRFSPKHFQYD